MYNRYLNDFISVARLGSFSKAAEEKYISPTAIIKHINNLEAGLGITLLERGSHGVSLTAAGEHLLEAAKEIMTLSDKAVKEAKYIQKSQIHTIRLGVSPFDLGAELINMMPELKKNLPELQLKIAPIGQNIRKDKPLNGMGITFDVFESPLYTGRYTDFEFLKLKDISLCYAVPYGHPLANNEEISLSDLSGHDLVMADVGESDSIDALREIVNSSGFDIRLHDTKITDSHFFSECVIQKYIAVITENWSELINPFHVVPVNPAITMPYGIIYQKNCSLTVKQLIAAITEIIE